MSEIDYDKFDLEGLSLEVAEAEKAKQPEPTEKVETIVVHDVGENSVSDKTIESNQPQPKPEEIVELVASEGQAENAEEQMTCPKCELQQPKTEQCSGCGIYVEKALAQMGQSKIQITATKF